MKQFRNAMYCVLILLVTVTGILCSQTVVAAAGEPDSMSPMPQYQSSSPAEKIEISCKYPKMEAVATAPGRPTFDFDVDLSYVGGKEPRDFDLDVQVPPQFTYSISPTTNSSIDIPTISLDPTQTYPQTIKLSISPYAWLTLEAGEYPITLTVTSGELKEQLQLVALVTEKYGLSIDPLNGRFNFNAVAGRDNKLTIMLSNSGTSELGNIKLSSSDSDRPTGWTVTFDPEEIKTLSAGSSKEIGVNIRPDPKALAGSYSVKLQAKAGTSPQQVSDSLELRVTALSPTTWGWVGVGIIILIIVGLVIMFKRLGRR